MIEKYIKYARHIDSSDEVLKWIEVNLSNFLNKYNGEDGSKNLENQDEIEHIVDYLSSDKAPKNMHKMAYSEAKTNTDKWNKALIKKGSKIIEVDSDIEIIKDFNDGFKIVKLIGKSAYEREGYLMRHCVASYHGNDTEIYSLRDKDNMPHCTMEKDQQIKGKGNGSINPKYINYIIAFLEEVGMSVGDNEMKNLGYLDVEKIKDDLHINTAFIKNKYLHEDEVFIGKDGKEYINLNILDYKPLINIQNINTVKIDIKLDISRIVSETIAYIKQFTEKLKDNAKIGASGDDAKIGASGDSAQIGASGNYAQIGASGDDAKIGASGDNAKIGASGYNAKIGASGDNAQIGASGNYAQIDISGKNSVCAAVGHKSKIRAIRGTWITLAEYNNDGICVLVKSAQIDGEILKENVIYRLIGGEFAEIVE